MSLEELQQILYLLRQRAYKIGSGTLYLPPLPLAQTKMDPFPSRPLEKNSYTQEHHSYIRLVREHFIE